MTGDRQYLKVSGMTSRYSKARKTAWNLIDRVLTANPIALLVVSAVAWVGGVILAVTQTQLVQWLLDTQTALFQ